MAGHVRKRGNKWYYSFEAASVDGKRKRIERVGGNTKKEAEAALRKALSEYENAGLFFEPSEISVADYMDYWFDNYVKINCKQKTQQAYNSYIHNHIKPSLGRYKLKSLTPAILQEFFITKTNYSKNTLSSIVNVIKNALNHAVHPYGFIKDNPMIYVKPPKAKEPKERVLVTEEVFQKILEMYPPGSPYYIPFVIGYHTALRVGEVTALSWEDVDFENSTISISKTLYRIIGKGLYIGTPKTASSVRTVMMGPTLKTELLKYKEHQEEQRKKYGKYYYQNYLVKEKENLYKFYSYQLCDKFEKGIPVDFICTRENGQIVSGDNFDHVNKKLREVGIKCTFHSLRHTHATTLIENGVSVKAVQMRLGHSTINTTMNTYVHPTRKMDEEAVSIFEKAIKNAND